MAITKTRIIGKGTLGASRDGNTITWPRRRRQDHKAGNFLVNIDLGVAKTIDSVTRDADGFIIKTSATGIGTWNPATEHLTTMINNAPTDVFADTPTAMVGVTAGTELIFTPTEDNGVRYEQSNAALLAAIAVDELTFEADEVGVRHHVSMNATDTESVFALGLSNNVIMRDVWAVSGNGGFMRWATNAAATDVCTIERCVIQTLAINTGRKPIRVRGEGFAKKVVINNCIFQGGPEGAGPDGVITTEGALAHVVEVNHCLFWRVGPILKADNALHSTSFTNSLFLSHLRYDAGVQLGSVSYTTCAGSPSVLANKPAAVALTTPQGSFLAFWKTPLTGEVAFPLDARPVSNTGSDLFRAGTPVAGVTEDIDGRPRNPATPDIGPTEDFQGFATVFTSKAALISIGII